MPATHSKKRLLVGPFLEAGLSDYMVGAFDDFDTLTFGSWPGVDIRISGLPGLQDILDLLPPDWSPDFLILWRPEYGYFPPGLENSSCPVAMLISDWYLAFSDSLEAAWRVDMVITGTRGELIFRAAGFDNVLAMPMLGYQPEIDGQFGLPADQRDIDVFMGGNPNWVIHRQREQVVAELLDLPAEVNLLHGPFVDRNTYNRLLGRSKIVVNQTVIGEINMKVYEVAAAGACLFVEEDNLDIRDYLVPDESVVLYNQANLREKIGFYLSHPEQRESIAQKAREAMARFTYRENFRNIVERIDELNKSGQLKGKRPCFELSPEDLAAGMVGYCLRHNGGDLLAPIALGNDPALNTIKGQLLQASAHYLARLGNDQNNENLSTSNDPVWPTRKILETYRHVHDQAPDYLPAAYCWARVAAAHLDASVALPLLKDVTELLLGGCAIPFSCADFFFWDPDTQYDFERKAWETLEKGQPLENGLRPLILEDVLVIAAQLATNQGDLKLSEDTLELAVAKHPEGVRARPLLAELMASQGQWERAVKMWREHLLVHPLHLVAYEGLLNASLQSEAVVLSDNEIQRYARARDVLKS